MQAICPAWFAFSLDNRLRRLVHDPERILASYVKPGMVCADIGCGPGFFTLALARLAGPGGQVIAVDLQPRMLARMQENAARHNLSSGIAARQCRPDDLMIQERLDFALAFWMVHEVSKRQRPSFFAQLGGAMKPGGLVLVTDPGVPWLSPDFRRSMEAAQMAGFAVIDHPRISLSRTALLQAKL